MAMPTDRAPGEALDRFVTRRMRWTWAAARLAIHHGRVAVDGVRCNRYHQQLIGGEQVEIDGAAVAEAQDDGVILCRKAAGLACSHQLEHAPLIYDAVPEHLRHPDLQTAGRLDRDTTGLIVLTIDGALIQALTDPRRKLAKRYELAYAGELAADAVDRVAAGLAIADDPLPCLPAVLALQDPGRAVLTLCEGRHHQVKRMIAALGGSVTALHRAAIGALALPADLAPGAMRPATPAELSAALGRGWWRGQGQRMPDHIV